MRRRRASDRAWSLIGLIHTIAPPTMRRIIAADLPLTREVWERDKLIAKYRLMAQTNSPPKRKEVIDVSPTVEVVQASPPMETRPRKRWSKHVFGSQAAATTMLDRSHSVPS